MYSYPYYRTGNTNGTITVTGEHTLYVDPDQAIVSIGVVTKDEELEAAQNEKDETDELAEANRVLPLRRPQGRQGADAQGPPRRRRSLVQQHTQGPDSAHHQGRRRPRRGPARCGSVVSMVLPAPPPCF